MTRWRGQKAWFAAPAALLVGALLLAAHALSVRLAGRPLGDWVLWPVFTAERLLPLLALGLLLAQLPGRARIAGLAAVLAGAGLGIVFRERCFDALAAVPGAAAHLFLTGPLACVLLGAALIFPRGLRARIALPLLPVIGAALALATWLGDPTFHGRHYLPLALGAEGLIVLLAVYAGLCLDRPWLTIGARVLGSWMVAIGFLYGGAYLAAKDRALHPPDFPRLDSTGEFPGFSPLLPALDRPNAPESRKR